MKELIEKVSHKKLAFYTKGFLNTSSEDWIDYKKDFFAHAHLLDVDYFTSEPLQIRVTDSFSVDIPMEMKELGREIEKAVNFLENSSDWDPDEGELYSSDTLTSAVSFLVDYALWAYDKHEVIIPVPKIYPGPSGSIDLLWKKDSFKLLINVKPYPQGSATFYGESEGEEYIEGKLNTSNINQTIFLLLFERQVNVQV